MKIFNIDKLSHLISGKAAKPADNAGKTPEKPGTARKDQVNLSQDAQQLSQLRKAAADLEEIRPEVVERLQKQLKEGEVKKTRYSNLIGDFSSPEEAEDTVNRLLQFGYSSYMVPVPGGRTRLYSGAFYTREDAQKQFAELASKGIKGQPVER